MKQQKYSFLFVSAPFSGIEVFMRNVSQINQNDFNIQSKWIWLDRKLNIFGLGGSIFNIMNWTVRASIFTYLRIRELERSGEIFSAAFFNHVTPFTFLFNFRKRVPSVLSLDSTPKLLDLYSNFYRYDLKYKLPEFILKIKYRFTQRAYEDAVFILAWSDVVKQSLIEDYLIPCEKIVVVPPGVDTERFTPVDRRTRDHKQSIKILFVGGEFIRKGGDVVLELAHEDKFKNHEFHFVTRTFKGKRGPNIFVYDNISPECDRLLSLYRDSDIFVLPTRGDFCPTNTICEAMATGLPVISTSVGGLNEIVQDGKTGCIINVDEKTQLRKVIEELSADREKRIRLGDNARELAEEKYDLKKNSEKIFLYMTLAAKGDQSDDVTKKHSGKKPIYG